MKRLEKQNVTRLTGQEIKAINGGTNDYWDDGTGNGCVVISDGIVISPTVPVISGRTL